MKKVMAIPYLFILLCLSGCIKNQFKDEELLEDPYIGRRMPLSFEVLDFAAQSFNILKVVCIMDIEYLELFHPGYSVELHTSSSIIGNIFNDEYVYFGVGLENGEAIYCKILNGQGEVVLEAPYVPN